MLLVKATLGDGEGHQQGDKHGGDGGELVERHFDALGLENQAGAEVDHDENQKGDQCQGAALFVQVMFHFVSPFLYRFVNAPSFV